MNGFDLKESKEARSSIEEKVSLEEELFTIPLNWRVSVRPQYKWIKFDLKESKEARSLNWSKSLTESRTLSQENSSQ